MPSLRVVRDAGYADRIRAYWIILDGERIGEIGDGEAKELTISPGKHSLSIRIDWCGSKTLYFTSSDREVATFRVKSNLRGARLLLVQWYLLFARNSYLLLEQVT